MKALSRAEDQNEGLRATAEGSGASEAVGPNHIGPPVSGQGIWVLSYAQQKRIGRFKAGSEYSLTCSLIYIFSSPDSCCVYHGSGGAQILSFTEKSTVKTQNILRPQSYLFLIPFSPHVVQTSS